MRDLAAIDAEIAAGAEALAALRRERLAAQRAERAAALEAIRLDFVGGMKRPDICAKHGITIGQLAGYADRYGWTRKVAVGRDPVVTGADLEALKLAYQSAEMRKVVAGRFGISTAALRRYGIRHGWERSQDPLRKLTPLQHATYRKLRPIVGRNAALAEARAEVTA